MANNNKKNNVLFLDSSFIIALYDENEQKRHETALELLHDVPWMENTPKVINNVVFNEVLNKLNKSRFRDTRDNVIAFLLNVDNIYFVDKFQYKKALSLYKKCNYNINYSDLLIILSMKEHGIKNILSFDSDFSKIRSINNIYIKS